MNGLNGFKDHRLDDEAFGAKGSIVSAFDAFRKTISLCRAFPLCGPPPPELWPFFVDYLDT